MSDFEPVDHVDKLAFMIAVFVGTYLIGVAALFIDHSIWIQIPVVVLGWSVTYVSSVILMDHINTC
jgi:hypothetical protein